jgi:hypothetical protein
MSPLWSDEALAKAAWAKAVDTGLVVDATAKDRVRRIPRPRVHSFAL